MDDKLFFMAAINGALNELTKEYNWEAFGDMTPAEAAAAMLDMYEAYVSAECTEGCICTLPPPYDIDIGIPLKIIRMTSGGSFEELVGSTWETPTGDYEEPTIPARSEPTADERKCLAAKNAANVYENFYEEATDAYQAFSTPFAVADAILDAVVVVMGLFGQATAASNIAFGQTIFETFVDLFNLVTGDVWDSDFTEELACLFLDNATDTAGVVSFDFAGIRTAILMLQTEAGGDLNRQILLRQVEYLLSLVGEPGLALSGTTTAIVDDDCSMCVTGAWQIHFDFRTGAHGATIPVPCPGCWPSNAYGGTLVGGVGIDDTNYTGSSWGSTFRISGLGILPIHGLTEVRSYNTKNSGANTSVLWLFDGVVYYNFLNGSAWSNTPVQSGALASRALDAVQMQYDAASNRNNQIHDWYLLGNGVFPPGAVPRTLV